MTEPSNTDLDAQTALKAEQAVEDTPPRRREALWPEVAPHSNPQDIPATDPDGVDQSESH